MAQKAQINPIEGGVEFVFTNNNFYLQNGTITYPLNSLSMTLDKSDMVTFKNCANDIVLSIKLQDLGKTKAEMEELYAQAFVGGSGGITPEEVEEMIDDAVDPLVEAIDEKEEVIARALTDLHENKLDASAYTPSPSITVDQTLNSGSTNPVANSAITTALTGKEDKLSSVIYTLEAKNQYSAGHNGLYSTYKTPQYDYTVTSFFEFGGINGVSVLRPTGNASTGWHGDFSLVETSAVTTSMTSSSTDSQVPSAKCVFDQLGGLKLVKLTQSEYDALVDKDSDTLYVIVNN